MAEEQTPTEPVQKTGSNKGLIITLITLLVILMAGGAYAGWMFLGEKEVSDKPAIPHFMEMEPFVITLKSEARPHYLQIKLSLMSRDPETLTVLETYRPMVRNEIVRYLNTLAFEAVGKPEAPDRIRTVVMTRVNALLVREQIEMTIDDIIITDLVIQ